MFILKLVHFQYGGSGLVVHAGIDKFGAHESDSLVATLVQLVVGESNVGEYIRDHVVQPGIEPTARNLRGVEEPTDVANDHGGHFRPFFQGMVRPLQARQQYAMDSPRPGDLPESSHVHIGLFNSNVGQMDDVESITKYLRTRNGHFEDRILIPEIWIGMIVYPAERRLECRGTPCSYPGHPGSDKRIGTIPQAGGDFSDHYALFDADLRGIPQRQRNRSEAHLRLSGDLSERDRVHVTGLPQPEGKSKLESVNLSNASSRPNLNCIGELFTIKFLAAICAWIIENRSTIKLIAFMNLSPPILKGARCQAVFSPKSASRRHRLDLRFRPGTFYGLLLTLISSMIPTVQAAPASPGGEYEIIGEGSATFKEGVLVLDGSANSGKASLFGLKPLEAAAPVVAIRGYLKQIGGGHNMIFLAVGSSENPGVLVTGGIWPGIARLMIAQYTQPDPDHEERWTPEPKNPLPDTAQGFNATLMVDAEEKKIVLVAEGCEPISRPLNVDFPKIDRVGFSVRGKTIGEFKDLQVSKSAEEARQWIIEATEAAGKAAGS